MATFPPFEIPIRRRQVGRHAHPYDKSVEVLVESFEQPRHRADDALVEEVR